MNEHQKQLYCLPCYDIVFNQQVIFIFDSEWFQSSKASLFKSIQESTIPYLMKHVLRDNDNAIGLYIMTIFSHKRVLIPGSLEFLRFRAKTIPQIKGKLHFRFLMNRVFITSGLSENQRKIILWLRRCRHNQQKN